jgi:peptidoglycan/LPS O-acetylase OafA/YrhL
MAAHYAVFPWLSDRGGIGVDLFFVLSGFLISGLLIVELRSRGRLSIGRFYLRRGFKIYPAFYVLLAITALIFWRMHLLGLVWRDFVVNTIFLQNYLPTSRATFYLLGHSWSLAVEEHFYLTLPLLLVFLHRRNRLDWIPAIGAALLVVCFALRIPYSRVHGPTIHLTHLRIDALFTGVVLGYFYHYRAGIFSRLARWWALPVGLALLLPVAIGINFSSLVLTCNVLGFAFLVGWSVNRKLPGTGLFSGIGKYSYSIYLVHLPLAELWSIRPLTRIGFCCYVATSIAVGIGMARLIELPALRLRDRLTGFSRPRELRELSCTVRNCSPAPSA